MLHYKIQSGRTQPLWLTTVYSFVTIAAIGTLFLLALPVILAVVAVLIVAGAIAYWRLTSRLKKMRNNQSAHSDYEDVEYVDFEVIDGEKEKT